MLTLLFGGWIKGNSFIHQLRKIIQLLPNATNTYRCSKDFCKYLVVHCKTWRKENNYETQTWMGWWY